MKSGSRVLVLLAALLVLGGCSLGGRLISAIFGSGPDMAWPWWATMSNWRSTESRRLSPGGCTIARRALLLALMLAPLAACGKKGPLELPSEGDEDEE
jgi:predicted small lipoprotein YifL